MCYMLVTCYVHVMGVMSLLWLVYRRIADDVGGVCLVVYQLAASGAMQLVC